ncbi:MAG: helix-turn-helix transcriptional regulator [Oscillospiraceae bacterium]|nr:helix-turn-helix transcriptional regulator [Oscillospiraceae bacterium]
MSKSHNCPCSETCALQGALGIIGGKWKLPILCSLSANGDSRYNELLKNIQGISNTMLSKTLREMEDDGLVIRSEYLEVPVRVEYRLTDKARKLHPILTQLIQWSLTN